MARFLALLFTLVLIVLATTKTESTITCRSVLFHLSPCIPYAEGFGKLSSGCCNGIKHVNDIATSTPDRQLACNCLKSLASRITNFKFGLIAGAPTKCGVNVPYLISPSTDCSKVR